MKKFNIPNYARFKNDLNEINLDLYNDRDKLIVENIKLVENIARSFSTMQQASGVLDITDLIQEGTVGLIAAVDKIEWQTIKLSTDPERTLKSFLSKRIKGAIRRAIDINRGKY
jgi:DNA-directed RNA polymerase specialized sigma subunit